MIKKIEFSHSINFVDHRNRFIGFDLTSQCCEDFGWFITTTKPTQEHLAKPEFLSGDSITDLDVFLQDYTFIEEPPVIHPAPNYDCGGSISHRIEKLEEDLQTPKTKNAWIVLYNYHNGYYSHGWCSNVDQVETYI